jgi:hypothetical protein
LTYCQIANISLKYGIFTISLCACIRKTGKNVVKKASTKGTIKLSQTDDGLHLDDSILWFDSRYNGELSFLSSASFNFQTRVPQVIATEETVKILEAYKKKPNALVCQYNRPFSIGRLKMELLPSGAVLGGASLYVETEKGRLLYAPQLQPQRIDTVRKMQLKKAHSLVLGAYHPDPHAAMPSRKKEKERLLETVKKHISQGQYPIIICEPVPTAQEITKLLADNDVPLAAHDAIYRVNTVYEAYGSNLGKFTRHSKHTKNKVIIFPLPNKKTMRLGTKLPEGPILYIEDTMEETIPPSALAKVTERFFMGSTCDGSELREVVAAVKPKELYIMGPYAKRYISEFSSLCAKVEPLFINDQPTLF